jgi:Fe-S cluster assembly protein SufD
MKYIDLNQKKQNRLIFDKAGQYLIYLENLSGDFYFDICAENVDLNIFGLFIGKKDQQFNLKTFQNHIVGNSSSNLLIKGVFYDQSKFFYQGLIRIEKEAQQSKAYQKNQNLLLSKDAFVDSCPYLEILANDVFCTHGSTTGRLNQEEIYYLTTRGINKKQAEKLLIEGFINEVKNFKRNNQ